MRPFLYQFSELEKACSSLSFCPVKPKSLSSNFIKLCTIPNVDLGLGTVTFRYCDLWTHPQNTHISPDMTLPLWQAKNKPGLIHWWCAIAWFVRYIFKANSEEWETFEQEGEVFQGFALVQEKRDHVSKDMSLVSLTRHLRCLKYPLSHFHMFYFLGASISQVLEVVIQGQWHFMKIWIHDIRLIFVNKFENFKSKHDFSDFFKRKIKRNMLFKSD